LFVETDVLFVGLLVPQLESIVIKSKEIRIIFFIF